MEDFTPDPALAGGILIGVVAGGLAYKLVFDRPPEATGTGNIPDPVDALAESEAGDAP